MVDLLYKHVVSWTKVSSFRVREDHYKLVFRVREDHYKLVLRVCEDYKLVLHFGSEMTVKLTISDDLLKNKLIIYDGDGEP